MALAKRVKTDLKETLTANDKAVNAKKIVITRCESVTRKVILLRKKLIDLIGLLISMVEFCLNSISFKFAIEN